MTRIEASQHVVDRSTHHISDAPKDAVFVNIVLDGTAFLYHAGGLTHLRPGDSFVHSTMSPYLLGFERDIDLFIVDIDADRVPEPLRYREGLPPEIFASTAASRRLAADGIAALNAGFDPLTDESLPLGAIEHLLGGSDRYAARERAMELIRANLANPDFSAVSLAEAMHLSERQLRRVFEGEDLGPGGALLESRLQRAFALLGGAAEPVGEVAAACGFRSASAFARAFRARFGMAPSERRAEG